MTKRGCEKMILHFFTAPFFTILYKTLSLLFTWLWYLIAIDKSNTVIKDFL